MTLDEVTHATPETYEGLVSRGGLVVVYFWGPECPNCEVFAADLPGLLSELPKNVQFVKVNAYDSPELARRYGIAGVPAFVVFDHGVKKGMMRQYYGRDYFRGVMNDLAAGISATVPAST